MNADGKVSGRHWMGGNLKHPRRASSEVYAGDDGAELLHRQVDV